jgi:predicted NBD/HSP70 family sugar kinase
MSTLQHLRHHYTRKPNLADVKRAKHNTLRMVNRRILLSLIADRQPVSRADLARLSGMNKATVSTIMSDLLSDMQIIEDGMGATTPSGGKPPTHLRLNEKRYGLFGLDVRPEETILALSDFNGRIVARHSFATASDPQIFAKKAGQEIAELRAAHTEFAEIAGVGVSLPGLVDHHSGTFLMSLVLPWREVPIVELLEKECELPVSADTSARCAALAEIWFGKSRHMHGRNLLYVGVSSGLSCGVVIDGGLYRGAHNTAGQFGHIPIDLSGERCRCGLRGCWDLYASDRATVARYQKLRGANGGRAITMRRLVELTEAGDMAAMQAVRETARYLGIGIAGLVNGFDPEAVVIGGEITKAWGLIESIINEEVAPKLLDPRARQVTIRRSTFEVRPTLKGALTLVLNEQLSVPHIG